MHHRLIEKSCDRTRVTRRDKKVASQIAEYVTPSIYEIIPQKIQLLLSTILLILKVLFIAPNYAC